MNPDARWELMGVGIKGLFSHVSLIHLPNDDLLKARANHVYLFERLVDPRSRLVEFRASQC